MDNGAREVRETTRTMPISAESFGTTPANASTFGMWSFKHHFKSLNNIPEGTYLPADPILSGVFLGYDSDIHDLVGEVIIITDAEGRKECGSFTLDYGHFLLITTDETLVSKHQNLCQGFNPIDAIWDENGHVAYNVAFGLFC